MEEILRALRWKQMFDLERPFDGVDRSPSRRFRVQWVPSVIRTLVPARFSEPRIKIVYVDVRQLLRRAFDIWTR